MLQIQDIIKHIGVEQLKIGEPKEASEDKSEDTSDDTSEDTPELGEVSIYDKYINNSDNYTFDLDSDLLSKLPCLGEYYGINVDNKNKRNSFIYSVMTILDKEFIHEMDKSGYITEIRKKLAYDLENEYRKLNYVGKKKYKKSLLQGNLLKLNNALSEENEQYICDYFGINVYTFILDSYLELSKVVTISGKNDDDKGSPYKPTIFLIYYNDKNIYCPLLHKKGNSIHLYSKSDIMKEIHDMTTHKKKKKTLKSMNNYLLKELQEMAEKVELPITKKSKTGKDIMRTKKELYDDLTEHHS